MKINFNYKIIDLIINTEKIKENQIDFIKKSNNISNQFSINYT